MSIQRTLATVTGLLVAGALVASIALLLLTALIDRNTDNLGTAVRRLHLAETAEIDLLTHARMQDPVARAVLEAEVRTTLRASESSAKSPLEHDELDRVQRGVDAYFRDPTDSISALESAIFMLDELVDLDVQDADANREEAHSWDKIGSVVGVSVAMLLATFVTLVLIGARALVLRPILSLSDTMKQFASGVRDSVAPERGPAELRAIARQFNEMSRALSRQHEHQLVFLAGVAHDLRNPLSALRVSAAAVAPDQPLPAEPRLRRMVEVISKQVVRLDRMVSDLLDTARIEAGRLELRCEPCDARAIVRDSVELFEDSSSLHRITTVVPEQPVLIDADPLRLGQVLNNLVSNAIKYSPSGGEIQVQLEASEGAACFVVTDRGSGIGADELPHVFEPFRRARSTRDDIPGVGLGLSVARRIVEAHGGHIEVESAVGWGTTFRIRLPLP